MCCIGLLEQHLAFNRTLIPQNDSFRLCSGRYLDSISALVVDNCKQAKLTYFFEKYDAGLKKTKNKSYLGRVDGSLRATCTCACIIREVFWSRSGKRKKLKRIPADT